jgi:hypothetical protein
METTEVSETTVNKNLTPGKYPKESTLHNVQTFGLIDREVAELREQISGVANSTSVQHNNCTVCDVRQVQSGQRPQQCSQ